MENIAHSLCGLRIAQLGWTARLGPRAAWVGVIAANLPDVDVLWGLVDRDVGTWYHRGITHSVFGIPWIALLGALGSRRWIGGAYADHLRLWLWALLSHALMDWPTTWGTLLGYPLSEHRFSLGWVFIVDPMFWLLLGGVGRWLGARAALLSLAGWYLVAAAGKELAEAQAPVLVRSFPAPLAPLNWTAVATEGERVRRWFLTPWSAEAAGDFAAPVGPEVELVRSTRVGERTLWMARAPVLLHDGEELRIVDLAYSNRWTPDEFRFESRWRGAERVGR